MERMLEGILSRPKTVLTLMLVVLVAGIITYQSIPKESAPDIDVPVFVVGINQQGISPEDAERLLIRPMETTLQGLDGLKELTAIASESRATIVLEFGIDFDKDAALSDVREKVNQAKAELPADADEPIITETNFSLVPTITVALSGDVPERTLFQHARRLQDEIESISTVREANMSGNREELLEVILNLELLESYNITQQEILNAVTQNNQLVAAGFVDEKDGRFNVKVPGLIESAEDVFAIPVKQNGEGVITLGDLSDIRRTFKDANSYTRVNGKTAISIDVVKRTGTNIIENNQAVRDIVEEYSKDWPEAIKVDFLLDQSEEIYEILGSLQASIMTAIALVMIVVVATLGLRSALLVGFSIPLSFMAGFMILGLMGQTVNNMVMFGLVLTVGLLVDGAIVVTEYADRKMAEGMPQKEAYKRAATMMLWPIVSSTATTLAAFLPLILWPGVAGEFMSYLPMMVMIVLIAALATAMIFLPTTGIVLGQVFNFIGRHGAIILGGLTAIGLSFVAYNVFPPLQMGAEGVEGLNSIDLPMFAVSIVGVLFISFFVVPKLVKLGKIIGARMHTEDNSADALSGTAPLDFSKLKGGTGLYARVVHLFANNIVGNVVALAAIVGICFATVTAMFTHGKGVEFFIDEEPTQAVVMVSARGNFSATESDRIVKDVEDIILSIPGIKAIVATSQSPTGQGGGGGSAIGGVQDKPADVIGDLALEMDDYAHRPKWDWIEEQIRLKTGSLPGIKVEPRIIEGGPPSGKDVRLEVKSSNYEDMVAAVQKVREYFNGQADLQDVEDGRPLPGIEWELDIDREQAARYNADIAAVGYMVQLVTNGAMIGQYRPDDTEDEVEIRIRLPEDQRGLESLDTLRLRTPNGLVPLSNFVERKAAAKVSSIERRDGLYAMDVKANLTADAMFDDGAQVRPKTGDDKVAEVQKWLDSQEWNNNVQFRFRGADEDQKESGEFLQKAMVASLFLMFIILVTQFNSFYQTVLTLLTIILAGFGVMIGMMVTGQKFSIIMTGTGVIALAGIVVNNAIVLIDTFNRMRQDGTATRDAIVKSAAQRLRPILLTTITTICGLIPMATQINLDFFTRSVVVGGITSAWWVQLSTAIISGLAFSTILTLLVIPVLLGLPGNLVATYRLLTAKSWRENRAAKAATAMQPVPVGMDVAAMPPVMMPASVPVAEPSQPQPAAAEETPLAPTAANDTAETAKSAVEEENEPAEVSLEEIPEEHAEKINVLLEELGRDWKSTPLSWRRSVVERLVAEEKVMAEFKEAAE